MVAPSPNPVLVDLVIDLLEPGEEGPFTLSQKSLAKVQSDLSQLSASDTLLDNVLGLLEVAQHADDLLLTELAASLRRVAETSTSALKNQADAIRERDRAKLGLEAKRRAPMAGERAPKTAFKVSALHAAPTNSIHHRRAAEIDRVSGRSGRGR